VDEMSYKIITDLGVKTVQGKSVNMAEYGLPEFTEFELFVHKEFNVDPYNYDKPTWSVSEKISGRSIGKGSTAKEAIGEAVSDIKSCKITVDRFRSQVKKQAMKEDEDG